MKTSSDPRHIARQKVVQELFAWEAQKHLQTSLPENLNKKTTTIIEAVDSIDKIIVQAAPEWEIQKINQVDLAILRLAVYELTQEHTEPPKAIIDEAVELAKEFGNENSPSFVNGALGKALDSNT